MKVIIDIDEEMISLIKDKSVECFNVIHYGQVLDAIYHVTPIPDNAKMVEPQENKKVNCKSTKCENCINRNYCDYEPVDKNKFYRECANHNG